MSNGLFTKKLLVLFVVLDLNQIQFNRANGRPPNARHWTV